MIPPSRDAGDRDSVREHFRWFAERDAPGASPLYAGLAGIVARDIDLASFLDAAPATQRRPTLLLAAVHWLLLRGVDHDLRAFYPNLVDDPDGGDPSSALHDFVHRYDRDLRALAATRSTQTNEASRCSGLALAFARAHELSGRPLALVELGASAGFLLNADRYFYDFGPAGTLGDAASPVHLTPELRGPLMPPVPRAMPSIVSRTGIDLHPVDVRDEDAIGWLRACIWPEQRARFETFDAALSVARVFPPTLVQGDAIEFLPEIVAQAPRDAAVCIFHSAFTAYLSQRSFERMRGLVQEVSRDRRVLWIASEGLRSSRSLFDLAVPDAPAAGALTLADVRGDSRTARLLALAGYHGQWLRWTDRNP
ncbi:MAG TPA: DUF2332 domain-containing protein [Actinomycetota bacterium]|nr:DUF2332 domain-containing protein [Actinomycetota bacterium]